MKEKKEKKCAKWNLENIKILFILIDCKVTVCEHLGLEVL